MTFTNVHWKFFTKMPQAPNLLEQGVISCYLGSLQMPNGSKILSEFSISVSVEVAALVSVLSRNKKVKSRPERVR